MRRLLFVAAVMGALASCAGPSETMPACTSGTRLAILAQAVPSASFVPCVDSMPAGWNFGSLDVEDGSAVFYLDHDREGLRTAAIELTATCDVRGATSEGGRGPVERLVRFRGTLSPTFAATTFDVFDGGCVAYRYAFERGESAEHIELLNELFDSVGLVPRSELRDTVRRELGHELDP